MIRGVCDAPERIPARIYSALRRAVDSRARGPDPEPDCPCCAFWRGVLFAVIVGTLVVLAMHATK